MNTNTMKMIDVLCKLANGEIKEGQTVTIDGYRYELDDEGIFRRASNVDYIVTNEMMNDYYLNEEFLNSEVQLGDEEE